MPHKSFLPPNIWETPPESTKQMFIEHNKKVKLNYPTPYPSGSKTKSNPTLGKPTPAPQQVHQHSQDEPTEEPTPDTSTQTLVHKCLAESDIDPTDIQNVMPVSYAKRDISSHESSRQIQTHQIYVFARVNQSNPTEEPPPDTSTQILVNKCLAESGIDPTDIQNVMPMSYAKRTISPHESSRQIQPHQRYAFATSINPNTTFVMTWIPLTPQVQYQPRSKLPVMTHTTPSVLIAQWKPSAIIPSTPS